ncbi:hypothetical protein ES704_01644 [subsurface metagenome]|jgi:hypothetical protein
MTNLEGCIQFWETKLSHEHYLLDPCTQGLIESTVRYLKELEKLREEVKQRPKAKFPDSNTERLKLVRDTLVNAGYNFEHPTLVLVGQDGWFVILTPQRKPFQVIAHFDGEGSDFFAAVPELIE